jgi:preprotein translocase subunit SecG
MLILLTIVILLTCVVLAFFILVQNPKGGGLTGAFGSIGSQVMGVKQSTDVMEKGTWTSIGIIAGLCIVCVLFYNTPKEMKQQGKQPAKKSAPAQQQAPAGNQPAQPSGK